MFKICHHSSIIQSQIYWRSQCVLAYFMYTAWWQKRSLFLQTCSYSAWRIWQLFSYASYAGRIQQGKLFTLIILCDVANALNAADLYFCALTIVSHHLSERYTLRAGQDDQISVKGSFEQHLVVLQDPVLAGNVGGSRGPPHATTVHVLFICFMWHIYFNLYKKIY